MYIKIIKCFFIFFKILNLIPDIRKNFDVQLFTTKNFYGAHEAIYKVQINFDKIDTTLQAGNYLNKNVKRKKKKKKST